MISWPVLFFVLATVAAYLGFFGLSGPVAVVGQMLFWCSWCCLPPPRCWG